MAIRLQGGFTSEREGSEYVVNIHDSAYSGTVIPFDIRANGFKLSYDHGDKGRNVSILTSYLKIRMNVKNADIKSFMQAVVDSAETRFTVEVTKDGNKFWYGYIVPDQMDLQDVPYSSVPELRIKAVDGIGRLQKIDYNNAGAAYTGKATMLDHLYNVLDKIGFSSFYASSEDYVITYTDWWNEQHTYATTSEPLELSRFDHRALLSVDQSGDIKYLSAYDVLGQLLAAWNCRILFFDGAYYVVQINAYKTDGNTKVIKRYDKDKLKQTTSTTDLGIWNRTTGSLSGFNAATYDSYHNRGRFRYYPALREVKISYEHFTTDNLIPGNTWNESASPTATFDNLDFNNGNARLVFQSRIESKAVFADPDNDFQILTYHFRLVLQVGTKYLKRDYSWTNGTYKYGPVTWSDTLAYYHVFTEYMYNNDFPRYTEVSFVTPQIPESGNLSLQINWFATYNTSGQQVFTSSTDYTRSWSWIGTGLHILVDGNLEDQTNVTVYTATNDDGSTNSQTEDVSILIGSGPSANTFGNLEVYDGANWVNDFDWRKGNSGSYNEFGQLLALEMLAGQKYGVERYIGEITGSYAPYGRLQRIHDVTTQNYIFLGGTLDMQSDRWAGEWVLNDVDESGLSTQTPDKFTSVDIPIIKEPFAPIEVEQTPNNLPAPINTIEAEVLSPIQIGIDTNFGKEDPITSIPVIPLDSDGYIFAGDELLVTTPTGEQIPVKVTQDAKPGDTSIQVVPITAGVEIPNGSILEIPELDLFAFLNRLRRKQICFYSDIRVSDAIAAAQALFFFRIDESSEYYLNKAVSAEIQVHTPGSGAGTYDFQLKLDGQNIFSSTLSETTTLNREILSYTLVPGLYTFHLDNITGTIPQGVNFCLTHVEPLQKPIYINPNSNIAIEYASEALAFAGGVRTNRLYSLSLDNVYGMAWGLVVRLYSTIGFASDAVSLVNDNEWYAVSLPNDYGVFVTAVRVKNYTGTKYSDDSAAAAGGVAVDEWYVLDIDNPYGMPEGFIKLRKS